MGSTPESSRNEYRQLRDIIYTFFYYSNKPVALSEIQLQFKGYKKATVLKVIDDLVEKKKIMAKAFGKSKIYCLSQNMTFNIDEEYTDEIDAQQNQEIEDKTLRFIKWKYDNIMMKLEQVKKDSKLKEIEISQLESVMTEEEYERAISKMKAQIKEFKNISVENMITADQFNQQKKLLASIKKECTKRKNIFNEIIDNVSEGMGCSKKAFLEDVGIDSC